MQSFTRMGTGTSKITCPIIAVAMSVQFYFQFLFYRKMCQCLWKHTPIQTEQFCSHYPSDIPVSAHNRKKQTSVREKKCQLHRYSKPKESWAFFSHCRNCQHCVKFRYIILAIKWLDQRLNLSDITTVLYKNLFGPYILKSAIYCI